MPTRAAVQILLALCFVARAGAQETTSHTDTAKANTDWWMAGFAVGMPWANGPIPQLFTTGATFAWVHPNHLGADVSVGTMPYLFSFGVLPIGLRLGIALPMSVAPHVLLIPSTGVSAIGAAGNGGGGGVAGVNVGASTVFYDKQIGLKTSLTWHGFAGATEGVWLLEFGIVSLPAGLP